MDTMALALKLLRAARCPACDGSGCIMEQTSDRRYVTREMALDAGYPEMEGSLYSDEEWGPTRCQWCHEREALTAETARPEEEP